MTLTFPDSHIWEIFLYTPVHPPDFGYTLGCEGHCFPVKCAVVEPTCVVATSSEPPSDERLPRSLWGSPCYLDLMEVFNKVKATSASVQLPH